MDAFTRHDEGRGRLSAVHGGRCHNGAHFKTARRNAVDGVKYTWHSMGAFTHADLLPSRIDGDADVIHIFFYTNDVRDGKLVNNKHLS